MRPTLPGSDPDRSESPGQLQQLRPDFEDAERARDAANLQRMKVAPGVPI